MTDRNILDDDQHRPYLTSGELRAVRIPDARRRGLDPEITAEVLERAALTIDKLDESITRLNAERADHIQATDDVIAQATESEPAAATRLLAAAQSTADALVSTARAEADALVESAQNATVDLRASNARLATQLTADTEDLRQELLTDLRLLRERATAERAEIVATLARWGSILSEKRQHVLDALSVIPDALADATAGTHIEIDDVPTSDLITDYDIDAVADDTLPDDTLPDDEALAALDPDVFSSEPTPTGPVPRVTTEDIADIED